MSTIFFTASEISTISPAPIYPARIASMATRKRSLMVLVSSGYQHSLNASEPQPVCSVHGAGVHRQVTRTNAAGSPLILLTASGILARRLPGCQLRLLCPQVGKIWGKRNAVPPLILSVIKI